MNVNITVKVLSHMGVPVPVYSKQRIGFLVSCPVKIVCVFHSVQDKSGAGEKWQQVQSGN